MSPRVEFDDPQSDALDARLRAGLSDLPRRAPQAPSWDRVRATRPPSSRPVLVAAVVLLMLVAGSVVVVGRDRARVADLGNPDAVPVAEPMHIRHAAASAEALPAPGWDFVQRERAAAVWTGSAYLVWGGYPGGSPANDGAMYSPTTRSWRPITPAPIENRGGAEAVWTGTEMIVWGGSMGAGAVVNYRNGAAYDPVKETWRPIAPAPAEVAGFPVRRMTFRQGRIAVAFGEGTPLTAPDAAHPSVAIYDLATDAWRLVGGGAVADMAMVGDSVVAVSLESPPEGQGRWRHWLTTIDAATGAVGERRELPSSGPPAELSLVSTGTVAIVVAVGADQTRVDVYDPKVYRWLRSFAGGTRDLGLTFFDVSTSGRHDVRWRNGQVQLMAEGETVLFDPVAGSMTTVDLRDAQCISPSGSTVWAEAPDAGWFTFGGFGRCSGAVLAAHAVRITLGSTTAVPEFPWEAVIGIPVGFVTLVLLALCVFRLVRWLWRRRPTYWIGRPDRVGAVVAVVVVLLVWFGVGAGVGVHTVAELVDRPADLPAATRLRVASEGDLTITAEALPPAPFAIRDGASGVWTGSQFIVWGGRWDDPASVNDQPLYFNDGATYDPATKVWRMLPAAPIVGRWNHAAVWTGREMVVLGGTERAGYDSELDGAAYNPTSDTWRHIAASPHAFPDRSTAVWVAGRVVVSSDDKADMIMAYDPAADRWDVLLESGSGAVAVDSTVVAYVADRGIWKQPGLVRIDPQTKRVDNLVALGKSHNFGFDGRQVMVRSWDDQDVRIAVLDPVDGRWVGAVRTDTEQPNGGFQFTHPVNWFNGEKKVALPDGRVLNIGRSESQLQVLDPLTGRLSVASVTGDESGACNGYKARVVAGAEIYEWGGNAHCEAERHSQGRRLVIS